MGKRLSQLLQVYCTGDGREPINPAVMWAWVTVCGRVNHLGM